MDIAGSLPLSVISEIFGVPEEDRTCLYDLTNRMFASPDPAKHDASLPDRRINTNPAGHDRIDARSR